MTSCRSPVLFVVYLICLLGLAGCAEMAEAPEELEREHHEIEDKVIGGENENGELAAVAITSVNLDGEQSLCTGTLVTPRVVLTAAHCVAQLSRDGMSISTGSARHVSVFDGEREIHRVGVADSVFHAEWNDSNLQTGVDIGLIYLQDALPLEPIPLDDSPADGRVGQTGKIVGFGRTENDTVGRKKSTTMRVEEFFRQQFLLKSSDARHRSACNGDSGGPLYLETGGQKVVSGVTSWGPPGCEVDDSFYVAVKPHLEWIRANIPAATTGLREKQKYFGPMGCGESVACREGCGNDGFCRDDCMEETSLDGQILMGEIYGCGMENRCEDIACIQTECRVLYERCMGPIQQDPRPNEPRPNEPRPNDPQPNDPQPNVPQPNNPGPNNPGHGGNQCSHALDCFNRCQDVPCLERCADTAAADLTQVVDSVMGCFVNRCDPTDWLCFSEQCLPELLECF